MQRLWRLTAVAILGASLSLFGGTKLSKAAISGYLTDVKECIKGGEQVNEIDKWGWTPLMWSVYYRHLPVTEYLLANGADPNIQATKAYGPMSPGATPLIIAVYSGLEDQTAALLDKGAKVDIADGFGMKAMDYANKFQFFAVADLLAGKGGSTGTPGGPKAAAGRPDFGKGVNAEPLGRGYTQIVLEEFTTTREIAKDYLSAIKECQASTLSTLTARKNFEKVALKVEGETAGEAALLVKVEVTELRITSGAARFWAGPFAGNSYARAKVKLVNAANGTVEREQLLTTENNAWAASWTMGASDHGIPQELGAMIAGYVTLVGSKK